MKRELIKCRLMCRELSEYGNIYIAPTITSHYYKGLSSHGYDLLIMEIDEDEKKLKHY